MYHVHVMSFPSSLRIHTSIRNCWLPSSQKVKTFRIRNETKQVSGSRPTNSRTETIEISIRLQISTPYVVRTNLKSQSIHLITKLIKYTLKTLNSLSKARRFFLGCFSFCCSFVVFPSKRRSEPNILTTLKINHKIVQVSINIFNTNINILKQPPKGWGQPHD